MKSLELVERNGIFEKSRGFLERAKKIISEVEQGKNEILERLVV